MMNRGKIKTSLTFSFWQFKNDNQLEIINLRKFVTTNVTKLSDMWHTSRPIQAFYK